MHLNCVAREGGGGGGGDAGFFSGRGAPLRNNVTDWRSEQILKANTKKALSQGGGGGGGTLCSLPLIRLCVGRSIRL